MDEDSDELELRFFEQEYKNFKHNAPFLYGEAARAELPSKELPRTAAADPLWRHYCHKPALKYTCQLYLIADLVMSQTLLWPSLTVQWLPVSSRLGLEQQQWFFTHAQPSLVLLADWQQSCLSGIHLAQR